MVKYLIWSPLVSVVWQFESLNGQYRIRVLKDGQVQ
jgi:hypothetical protein